MTCVHTCDVTKLSIKGRPVLVSVLTNIEDIIKKKNI